MEGFVDADASIAEAMGFSSFGSQNPNKRRRFNARADAVVASNSAVPGQQSGGGPRDAGSGANAMPLGVRTRNDDEIDLDTDEEGGANLADSGDGEHPKNSRGTKPDPHVLDAFLPAAVAEDDLVQDIQSKIDAITGIPSQATEAGPSFSSGQVPRGSGSRGSDRSFGRQRNEPKKWWDDYYDPKSNTNPWERLEQANGLQPRGTWMTLEASRAAMKEVRRR
ncbi:hypothetical protein GGS23DRAFT_479484 [Durotheca rogersii]|uniref:uncharacterized protein n=1 Tax=Durotheca rogersii TaxID=419775 RepID=UPI0022212465|nr:uncharacterized protein GGS23DRAFT_479484 [Durotheca rogersii]KAI5864031.1 hypothetical protein GGS23DRAFT_479484 [Durotheca rogersii]